MHFNKNHRLAFPLCMVQIFEGSFHLSHPWHRVTLACFCKYPNSFSRHVLSSDIIYQGIDPSTGRLITRRLIHKTSNLPKWFAKLIYPSIQSGGGGSSSCQGNFISNAFVLEESEVDLQKRHMSLKTRNLSHARFAQVEEQLSLWEEEEEEGQAAGKMVSRTQVRATCKVVSHFGWGLIRGKIEAWMSKRFKEHWEAKSRKALQFVLDRMIEANSVVV